MPDTVDRERIVLVQWSPVLAATMLLGTAALWVVPLLCGHRIAALLTAVPFLWVCWRLPKTLRGMGIEIDVEGIHPFDGRRTGTLPWDAIAAVGFGSYAGRHRPTPRSRIAALEVYPTSGAAVDRRLRGDWQDVDPPLPGLSPGCFRFTVSPYGPHAAAVEAAVRRFRPRAWAGPFEHGPIR